MVKKNSTMIDLKNKLILITGASSGIGRAISQRSALCGAKLILLGRNKIELERTYNSLKGEGHIYFTQDLTEYEHLHKIIRNAVDRSGLISGFVHSAGIQKTIPFNLSTPAVFKEIFEINVFAGFELARIISQKSHVSSEGASYVFLSSVFGKLGSSAEIAYCASKSALLSGTKAISLELAEKKIRCNCVLPGYVETDMINNFLNSMPVESKDKITKMHPLGIGKPSDVAALVTFLLSDEAKWITGGEYIIDGGYSIR